MFVATRDYRYWTKIEIELWKFGLPLVPAGLMIDEYARKL